MSTSLWALYLVRDQNLLLLHCILVPYSLRLRRLYHTLCDLGLHPPVGFICNFKVRMVHANGMVASRSKPGFTSSPSPSRSKMFLLGITTSMFILGIIALVLETTLEFQQMRLFLDPAANSIWSSYRTNVINAVGSTIARLMVHPHGSFHAVCLTQLIASISTF